MSYDELKNRMIIFGGQTLKGEFCIPRVHAFQLPDWMSTTFRARKVYKGAEKMSPYQSLLNQNKASRKVTNKNNSLYTVPEEHTWDDQAIKNINELK